MSCAAAAARPGRGGARCLLWITRHKEQRDRRKECMRVLYGLYRGGCVELLENFVRGGEVGGVRWPEAGSPEDRGLREDIRSRCAYNSVLDEGCEANMLETIKWTIGEFGLNEQWRLLYPLYSLLCSGDYGTARWILDTFDMWKYVNGEETPSYDPLEACASGKNPSIIKGMLDGFSNDGDWYRTQALFRSILVTRKSNLELCKWAKERFEVPFRASTLPGIEHGDISKWCLTTFSVEMTEELLNQCCENYADLDTVKWIVTEKSILPTPLTFVSACKNKTESNALLVEWLSSKVGSLSPSDLQQAIQTALCSSNIGVVDYLERAHHAMDILNSTPGAPASTLDKMLSECTGDLSTIRWFLAHVSMSSIEQCAFETAIRSGSKPYWAHGPECIMLLLNTFPGFTKLLPRELIWRVLGLASHLVHVTQFLSMFSFSSDEVAQCLNSNAYSCSCYCSSKVVKFLVTQFHLQPQHIKWDCNYLLYQMLYYRHSRCAEWLIDSFNIEAAEIVDMLAKWCQLDGRYGVDLPLVKMLLRKFPSLNDPQIVKKRLMGVFIKTPEHAAFAMRNFEVTMQEIRDFYNDTVAAEGSSSFPDEITGWLAQRF